MTKVVQDYIRSVKNLFPTITDQTLNFYINELSVTELKAKSLYICAGTIQKEIGYLFSGILRVFYIDSYGKEINVNFKKEGDFVTHLPTLEANSPCKFYFQTITPAVIINIPNDHLQNTCDKFPEMERYVRALITKSHNAFLERTESFLFENAEARYLNFVAKNPDLINHISITDLCTYLGMERQTLTRIRKKLLYK